MALKSAVQRRVRPAGLVVRGKIPCAVLRDVETSFYSTPAGSLCSLQEPDSSHSLPCFAPVPGPLLHTLSVLQRALNQVVASIEKPRQRPAHSRDCVL